MQNHVQQSSAAEMALQAMHDDERQFESALDRLEERREIDGVYSFVKLPNNRRWRSFTEAATTIRSLEVNKRYIPILRVLFHMAHLNESSLFPSLRSLKWTVQSTRELIDISMLFVPTLVNLSLELHDLPPQILQDVYQHLTRRVFRLRCLQIGLPDHAQIAPQAIQILANLLSFYSSTLTRVQIPTVFVIPSIIQCLSIMPKLSHIKVGFPSVPFSSLSLINSSQHAPSNRLGYFLSLQDFSFRGIPQTLYNAFSVFNFAALSEFYWNLEDGLEDMKEFLRFIGLCCPRLTTLTLGQSTMYLVNRRRPPVVSWDDIQGLLECRYLTAVSIYCVRVNMSRTELSTLLQSRSTWEKVEIYTHRPLKLKDMFLYGRYCPNLTSLGMYLDNLTGDELNDCDLSFPTTIPRLHELDLGHSTIDSTSSFPIGVFLYKISRRPVYVQALDHELWQRINEIIVSLYIEYATQSRTPLSAEAIEYISTVQQDKENLMDMDESDDD